jgi:hypothetical protein
MTEPQQAESPALATAPAADPLEPRAIRFDVQQTVGDLVWNSAELVRRSALIIVMGTGITVTSAIALVLGDMVSIIFVLLGLSFLTGLFVVPFVWWSVRQRRDLVLAPVSYEIDDAGISMTTSSATTRTAWSVYRRARETSRAFVLDTGVGTAIILLKRAMDPEVLGRVRGLLRRRGLLVEPSLRRRLRPLLWVAVGLLMVALIGGSALVGSAFVAGSGANVAMETVPTVVGRHVTINGTTDLPEGTILAVQIFQLDAWDRALASGASATQEFEYMDYVDAVVKDGRFSAETDMTGWPAGHGMSAVYFWIDASQPQAVIDRFGADGSRLQGPDVRDDEDTGRTLRVDRRFEIP